MNISGGHILTKWRYLTRFRHRTQKQHILTVFIKTVNCSQEPGSQKPDSEQKRSENRVYYRGGDEQGRSRTDEVDVGQSIPKTTLESQAWSSKQSGNEPATCAAPRANHAGRRRAWLRGSQVRSIVLISTVTMLTRRIYQTYLIINHLCHHANSHPTQYLDE